DVTGELPSIDFGFDLGNLNLEIPTENEETVEIATEVPEEQYLGLITINEMTANELLNAMSLCETNFCDAAQLLGQVQLRLHLLETLRQSPDNDYSCLTGFCNYSKLIDNALEKEITPSPIDKISVNDYAVEFNGYPMDGIDGVFEKIRLELENGMNVNLKYTSFSDFATSEKGKSNIKIADQKDATFISALPEVKYDDRRLNIRPFTSESWVYTNFNEVSFDKSCGKHTFDLIMKFKGDSNYISLQAKDKQESQYCELADSNYISDNFGNELNLLNTFVVTGTNNVAIMQKAVSGTVLNDHIFGYSNLSLSMPYFAGLKEFIGDNFDFVPQTVIIIDVDSVYAEDKINFYKESANLFVVEI
ncbi:MAG: hypothetical protein KAS30_01265, partial [Candidatus Diapherotrites archaeon]|nr:hypothetical protein [Candidatus Diapherotrites archaeon]